MYSLRGTVSIPGCKSQVRHTTSTATALLKLADGCEFQTITPNEILRDRLVFGIKDNKVRERLLRKLKLASADTDEICHAAESMLAQMKVVDDSATVNAVKSGQEIQQKTMEASTEASTDGRGLCKCWNCGRKHEYYKRELCQAFGKMCNKCHKLNHLANKVPKQAGQKVSQYH